MTRKIIITLGSLITLVLLITYFRWSSAIHQPLDFSHSKHVNSRIECSTCHPIPHHDVLPATTTCRPCHQDKSLPDKVEWVRVYRVAPDIIFSHRGHEKFNCSECHVQFTSGARWIHESRFKMDFCMDCHAQERAPNECRTCHTNR